jgi:hypothetical protein
MPIWVSDFVILTAGTGIVVGVPAHDQRDFDFAKKNDIEIIPVIEGGDINKEAYIKDGIHINSGFLNNLNRKPILKPHYLLGCLLFVGAFLFTSALCFSISEVIYSCIETTPPT